MVADGGALELYKRGFPLTIGSLASGQTHTSTSSRLPTRGTLISVSDPQLQAEARDAMFGGRGPWKHASDLSDLPGPAGALLTALTQVLARVTETDAKRNVRVRHNAQPPRMLWLPIVVAIGRMCIL